MSKKKRLLIVIPAVLFVFLIISAVVAFFVVEQYATATLKTEIDRNIKEISKHVLVEYDKLEVERFSFRVNLIKVRLSKPPLPGLIAIDAVKVRDFTSIGIKAIPTVVVLDNISGSVGDASIGIQRLATRFSLKNIPSQKEPADDWTVFFRNLQNGQVELEKMSFKDKETQFSLAAFKTDYAATAKNDRHLDLKINTLNFQSRGMTITTDALGFAASLDQHDVLQRLTKNVVNVSFRIPAGPAGDNVLFQRLTSLGYSHLSLGGDFTYAVDSTAKNLSLVWNASGAGMGRLHFDLRLTDFDSPPVPLDGSLAKLVQFLEQLLQPAQKAGFQGLKVVYQDFGLAPRLLKAEAQARGQSSEAFTRNLVGTINATLLLLPLPQTLKEQIVAVKTFLLDPKEIQVDITSKKPVRLGNLQGGSLNSLLEVFSSAEVKITAK
ncbi:MAG: hypothetical protein ACUVXF_10485 [Desulfobaccales bacterium]